MSRKHRKVFVKNELRKILFITVFAGYESLRGNLNVFAIVPVVAQWFGVHEHIHARVRRDVSLHS